MAFVTDTFTGTDGTNLTSHTADSGATWTTVQDFFAANSPIITGNRIRATSGSCLARASGVPTGTEYTVQATIRIPSGYTTGQIRYAGVIARASTGHAAYIARMYLPNDGTNFVSLEYQTSGASGMTNLGSASIGNLTVNTDYTLLFEVKDATKKVYLDGVLKCSSTDNTITAKGFAGVYCYQATGSGTDTIFVDNLDASDIASSLSLSRTAADTVTVADTATASRTVAKTAAQTVVLADTTVNAIPAQRTAAQTVTIADTTTFQASRGAAATGSVTLVDSTSVSTTQGTLTTPVALGPGVFLFGSQVTSWRNPADTVVIADSVSSSRAFQRTAADTVTAGDTATRATTKTRAATATLIATDQATTGSGSARVATGAVTLTDNATGSLSTPGAFSRTAAHTIHLADTATRSVSPHGSIDPPTALALSGYVSTLQPDPNVTTLTPSGYVSTLQIDPNVTTLTLER